MLRMRRASGSRVRTEIRGGATADAAAGPDRLRPAGPVAGGRPAATAQGTLALGYSAATTASAPAQTRDDRDPLRQHSRPALRAQRHLEVFGSERTAPQSPTVRFVVITIEVVS